MGYSPWLLLDLDTVILARAELVSATAPLEWLFSTVQLSPGSAKTISSYPFRSQCGNDSSLLPVSLLLPFILSVPPETAPLLNSLQLNPWFVRSVFCWYRKDAWQALSVWLSFVTQFMSHRKAMKFTPKWSSDLPTTPSTV